MTESLTPINVTTDAWLDLVGRVNDIIDLFANNVASTGGMVNGNISVNGNFYATEVYSGGSLVVTGARTVTAGTGLTGGGNLANNITISISANTVASLGKADTALQTGDFTGKIGLQNSVSVSQISATGTANSTTYLGGDGQWKTVAGGGGSNNVLSVNGQLPDGGGNVVLGANDISFSPSGNVSSLTVQGAITELENEKAPKASIRERLTANRTYYVRTDGSDSNDGLTNASGGAFLTIQRAMDVISDTIDAAGYTITVQVGNGTYTTGVVIKSVVGLANISDLIFQGNLGTPSSCILSMTAAIAFNATGINIGCKIQGFKITGTGTSYGLYAAKGGYINFQTMDFGSIGTTGAHIYAIYNGSTIEAVGNYSITGGGQRHWDVTSGGDIIITSRTITLTGTPAFTTFAYSESYSKIICQGNTFTGSATGTRYIVNFCGYIYTNFAGSNYLPGNAGGTSSNGGVYDNSTVLNSPWIYGSIVEGTYTVTDGASVDLNPYNGSIQVWTLGANRTPTGWSWFDGHSMTVMVRGSGFTITWTTMGVKWIGNTAPTLSSTEWTVIELWKVNGQIYGAYAGDVPL